MGVAGISLALFIPLLIKKTRAGENQIETESKII